MPVEGMPAIMDHDVLPDMGRMTRRLSRGAATSPLRNPSRSGRIDLVPGIRDPHSQATGSPV
jgi:hypothetical protein